MTPREALEFQGMQQAILEMGRRLTSLELAYSRIVMPKKRGRTEVKIVKVQVPAPIAPKADMEKVRAHLKARGLAGNPLAVKA